MRRVVKGFAALAAIAVCLGTLTACSPPDPSETADALAAELTTGIITTISSKGGADPHSVFGDLADFDRSVSVVDWTVSEEDAEAATVNLRWIWDVAGQEWAYTSMAELRWEENAWTVQWEPSIVHPGARQGSSFNLVRTRPETRADIVSASGDPIVTARDVYRIGVDKTFVTSPESQREAAMELSTRLDFDDPVSYAERVAAAGERAFVLAVTVRKSDADAWRVDELRQIPGVNVVRDVAQLAPTSTFARPILGRVGEATAEIIESSNGLVAPGDFVGIGGLQEAYNDQLAGVPGVEVYLDSEEPVFTAEADAGTPLAITLDIPIQELAEDVVAGHEGVAALVAIEPSTGAVLAAATTGNWNTASLGQYAPGSTFKVVTSLAFLRSGSTPDSVVDCPETLVVDGRAFANHPGYAHTGAIPLRDAIAYSCNTAFAGLSDVISASDLASAALSLGLGQPGPWAFEYFSGNVPADVTGTTHAAGLFGQGEVVASPMAMAGVAASIASGHTVTPVLVVGEAPSLSTETVPLTAVEAAALTEMMSGVVSYGTASALAHLDDLHAKTGTAEVGEGSQTNAWMIAFRDDLAVAVFVEDAGSGATSAGPLIDYFFSGLTRSYSGS